MDGRARRARMWWASLVQRSGELRHRLGLPGTGLGRALVRPLRDASLEVDVGGLRLTGALAHREMLEQLSSGHQPFMTELFLSHVRAGATVLDVGANLGWYSLMAAQRGANVVAVEPDPRTVPFLDANVRANGLADRVRVVPHAFGEMAGTTQLHLSGGAAQSSMVHAVGADTDVDVEVTTADSVLPPPATVDLVKIDVEGAEVIVLNGMRELLARSRDAVLFVECSPEMLEAAGTSPDALVAALDDLGYSPQIIDDAGHALRPVGPRFWETMPSWFDLYCVPG